MESLVLCRPPLTCWHRLLGRLPSSYRHLDAAVDALAGRVLDGAAPDVPADVLELAEQVWWAARCLRLSSRQRANPASQVPAGSTCVAVADAWLIYPIFADPPGGRR